MHAQALTEMLAVSLLAAPLLLGLWSLLALQDLQWTTSSAARFVAFDVALKRDALSARHGAALSSAQVAARLFDAAADSASGDAAAWTDYPALWRDPLSGTPWMEDRRAVKVNVASTAFAGGSDRATRSALALLAPARALGHGTFDLEHAAFVSAQVAAEARGISLLGARSLVLTDRVALLTDAWAAESPAHVERQVRGLAPSSWFAVVDRWLAPLRLPILLLEPSFADFCPGRVAPDIVPDDRLEPRSGVVAPYSPC